LEIDGEKVRDKLIPVFNILWKK